MSNYRGTGRQYGTGSYGSRGGGGGTSGQNNRRQGFGVGGWSNNKKNWKTEDKRPMVETDLPKGPVIAQLDVKDLDKLVEKSNSGTPEKDATVKVTKEDYQLLASYNWLPNKGKEGSATIIVPGLPARWSPPTLPAWLTQDQGTYFIDQNGFRSPQCPFEPALRALFTQHPNLDPSDIDIITDRNNLRKLFRFACGVEKFLEDFKLYVEVVNKTLVFTRWETETKIVIGPGEFRGFGHAFEEAFTKYTTGLVGSSGHNRLARYKFGGLNVVVRFSADAFLGSKDLPAEDQTSQKASSNLLHDPKDAPTRSTGSGRTGKPSPTVESKITPNSPPTRSVDSSRTGKPSSTAENITPNSPTKSKVLADDKPAEVAPSDPYDLIDLFEKSLNLKAEAESTKPNFEIIPGGMLLAQDRVLEIKTRGASRPIELADQIPQCWFSNTTNLYVGYHQRGCFANIDKQVLNAKDLEKWEENSQDDLRKMKALLEYIVKAVRSVEEKKAIIVCVGGKLKIHGLAKGETTIGTLPADLRRRWD